jgi:hypothetical protein
MSRFLITLGVVLVLVGLLWPLLDRIGLGRLPGDIVIERDNMRVYIPLVTSLVISLLLSLGLSLVFWLMNR